MSVNDQYAASRQFVASAPTMSTQMNAFATGKGRFLVQAAMFALIFVLVGAVLTRRTQGFVIVIAGLVALSLFGLAGTAYVWWRSRRKIVIGVTSDGLTVDQRRKVFPLVDAKLGPWVNMGVALHLQSGSQRFVIGGRDRRIAPSTRLDAPPAQAVDAWLWVAEFDELLAVAGRQSGLDSRGPRSGEPTRCLLFPNPYLAEAMGSFAFRKQHRLQQSLSKPSLVLDLEDDAIRVIDPNSDARRVTASRADVTATPATFQADSVHSGDGSTYNYPATPGLAVQLPGQTPLTIGCLDLAGSAFRFSWRGDSARSNERPAYVVSGADWSALVEEFGLTPQLEDKAKRHDA
ncbi:hypothetical protein H7K33_11615 [Mycobacterium paraense]|uniref:hypothetical protein n=1 Tax=Mycobacterium paraense TaxID=767916 RepID=UPI000A15329B|nr:hypothetical protein [Mycobacterium paraense]MCV7442875.1 hypothetical protein [Mycobacterium paraense]ORW46127.1 hypothetical protein AWB89_14190 [Mycobacterium paraense]